MPINIDQLKNAAPLRTTSMIVEGLESLGKIELREMTFAEQRHYSELGKNDPVAGVAWVLSTCVKGLEGTTVDDVNQLNPAVATKLTTAVFRLSNLLTGDAEEIEGN